MSKATYPLKLPLSIKKAAQRLAKEDGVSLNQWIAAAVAEKVGVVETAADFFKKRAGKAAGEGLMKFRRTAPKLACSRRSTARTTSCGQSKRSNAHHSAPSNSASSIVVFLEA